MGAHRVGVDVHRARAALEIECLVGCGGPHAVQDGELVLEHVESGAELREGQSEVAVLVPVPAGAQGHVHAPTAHVVHLCGDHRERPDGAERHRRDEGAQADALGVACQAGERRPCVGDAGSSVDRSHLEDVVGSEEGVEAAFLGGARHGEELLVAGALLRLGEDAQRHVVLLGGVSST